MFIQPNNYPLSDLVIQFPEFAFGNKPIKQPVPFGIQIPGSLPSNESGALPIPSLLTGLLAYWTLNEASGNRADSVGGFTMVPTGSIAVAASFGNPGNGADFTAGGYLRAGVVFAQSPWSVAGWAKTSTAGSLTRGLFGQGQWLSSTNNQGMDLAPAGGNAKLQVTVNAGVNVDVGTLTVANGAWAHFAITYDGTTVRSFVNGAADLAVARTATYSLADTTSLGNDIGLVIGPGSEVGWGIWGQALTPAGVKNLYNGGIGRRFSDFANLAG